MKETHTIEFYYNYAELLIKKAMEIIPYVDSVIIKRFDITVSVEDLEKYYSFNLSKTNNNLRKESSFKITHTEYINLKNEDFVLKRIAKKLVDCVYTKEEK